VNGLDDVKKQEEEMMAEQEELLKSREELAGRMNEDLKTLWTATIDSSKEELIKRVGLFYYEIAQDSPGITVGSPEWFELEELLTYFGIELDPASAGEDGFLEELEFHEWTEVTLGPPLTPPATKLETYHATRLKPVPACFSQRHHTIHPPIHPAEKHFEELMEALTQGKKMEREIALLESKIRLSGKESELDKYYER
jgi:hypothetical protein